MSIGFLPAAIPSIVAWAEHFPDRLYEAFLDAERGARREPTRELTAPQMIRLDEMGDHVMAVSIYEDDVVIVAAGPGLTQARAEQLVRRLVRANWQSYLLTIELHGLDVDELALTLTEVLHATDLTEAPVSRYAAAANVVLMDSVKSHARSWNTRAAREKFRGLMDAATERPQKVTRPGGDPVYVVAESVLDAYAQPPNAPQLVAAFAHPPGDMRMELHPRPAPRPAIVIDTLPDAAELGEE